MIDEFNKRCKSCEGILKEDEVDYCSYCKPDENTETKKVAKIKKVKFNPLVRKNSVKIRCIKCSKIYEITTNNEAIYTEEVKKNWICLLCRPKGNQKCICKN